MFNKANSVSWITKNNNETIDLDIQTGFDSSNYPNYAYKIKLSTDLNGNSLDYISDIMITGRNRGWITLPSTEERMSIIVDK